VNSVHEVRAGRIVGWLYKALEWRSRREPPARDGRYDSKASRVLRYLEVLRLDVVGEAGAAPSAYGWQSEDPLDLRWRCDPTPRSRAEVAHQAEIMSGDLADVRRDSHSNQLGHRADGRAIRRVA